MAHDPLSLDFGRNKPFCVYIYRDPRPRKRREPIYVGMGDTNKRPDRHWQRGTYNPLFARLLNKIRHSCLEPIIEYVGFFDHRTDAFTLEISLIQKFGRRDLKTGSLCNLTSGGDGFDSIAARKAATAAHAAMTPEQQRTRAFLGVATQISQRIGIFGLTPEQRSDSTRKQMAALTPEERTARSRKGRFNRTAAQRSEDMRKSNAARTSERRSEIARLAAIAANASATPEARRARPLKAHAATAARTPEERSAIALKREASLTPEQRSARMYKANAQKTPEERSANVHKAWATRRLNQATTALALPDTQEQISSQRRPLPPPSGTGGGGP